MLAAIGKSSIGPTISQSASSAMKGEIRAGSRLLSALKKDSAYSCVIADIRRPQAVPPINTQGVENPLRRARRDNYLCQS
jgi:hypothetical protein